MRSAHRSSAALLACFLVFAGSSRARASGGTLESPPVQQPGVRVEAPAPEPSVGPEVPATPPTPAIIEPEPAPSAVTPSSSDALPRYDQPLAVQGERDLAELGLAGPQLREVPPDGRGLVAVGGLLAMGGAILLVSGSVLSMDGNTELPTYAPMLAIGLVAPVAGGVLLGVGLGRRRAYRAWEAQQPQAIPTQGTGLIGAGGVLLVAGTISSAIAGISTLDLLGPPPTAAPMIGIGVTSMAVGATLIAVGARRHKRFEAWRRDTSGLARVRLAPTLGFVPRDPSGRGGLQLGLRGRF